MQIILSKDGICDDEGNNNNNPPISTSAKNLFGESKMDSEELQSEDEDSICTLLHVHCGLYAMLTWLSFRLTNNNVGFFYVIV